MEKNQTNDFVYGPYKVPWIIQQPWDRKYKWYDSDQSTQDNANLVSIGVDTTPISKECDEVLGSLDCPKDI